MYWKSPIKGPKYLLYFSSARVFEEVTSLLEEATMPGKKVQCSYCSRVMWSENLKKHVKIHEKAVMDSQPLVITGQKRQHLLTFYLQLIKETLTSVNQKTLVVSRRIQRFKPYLIKLSMMIQRETYHNK